MGNSAVSTYLEERAQRQIIYTPVTTSVLDSCIIVFEVIACPRGPAVGFERRSHKLCIEFCQAVRRALSIPFAHILGRLTVSGKLKLSSASLPTRTLMYRDGLPRPLPELESRSLK